MTTEPIPTKEFFSSFTLLEIVELGASQTLSSIIVEPDSTTPAVSTQLVPILQLCAI